MSSEIASFLEAGGKITKLPTRRVPRGTRSRSTSNADKKPADFSALPTSIKIRFGIK